MESSDSDKVLIASYAGFADVGGPIVDLFHAHPPFVYQIRDSGLPQRSSELKCPKLYWV